MSLTESNTNNNNEKVAPPPVVNTILRKYKDPLYFKKYYQEKIKGVRYKCDLCCCSVPNENKARHFKSKKHIAHVNAQLYKDYSEFD